MTTTLKFYYNGIRASDSKLQRCTYFMGKLIDYPNQSNVIMISAKHYMLFSKDVHLAFNVCDDTNPYSDYSTNEYIYVEPSHPMYAQVLTAYERAQTHIRQRLSIRLAQLKANHARRNAL